MSIPSRVGEWGHHSRNSAYWSVKYPINLIQNLNESCECVPHRRFVTSALLLLATQKFFEHFLAGENVKKLFALF